MAVSGQLYADVLHFTVGRYNRAQLYSQFYEPACNNAVCQACMYNNWPEPGPNPFDNADDENCEGVNGLTRFSGRVFSLFSISPGDPWVNYSLFTSREIMLEIVEHCRQRWTNDIYCSLWVNGQWVEIRGAYLVGSEFSLGSLDGYIDRFETGEPPTTQPNPYDFGEYRLYVVEAWWELGRPAERPWWVLTAAAMNYLADLDLAGGPAAPPNVRTEIGEPGEIEWVKKVLAHAIVCWQSPEWENGQALIDIIGPNSMAPFPWNPVGTPTFVYWIERAVGDVLQVDVAVESSTWGQVKAAYQEK